MKPIEITLCTYLLLLIAGPAFSQNAVMIYQGVIEFEKRVNAYAILDKYYLNDGKGGAQFAQQYKASNPQFKVSEFILSFNDRLSYYAPVADKASNPFLSSLAGSNTIWSDLKNNTFTARKNVLGKEYLIGDSTRKIQWKITGEIRDIAGFSCRRANAIIMDSVYVVAFYTDQIIPKSGPESFAGLPGMILGVALPYEHVTWFATRVSLQQVLGGQIKLPEDGKKLDNAGLLNVLVNDPVIKGDMYRRTLYFHNILL